MARKLTRRDALKLGAAGAGGLALAGCGGSGESGSSGGKTTLKWWDYYSDANQEAVEAQLARYMEANPDITVERRAIPFADLKNTLLRGASAGELPDIAIIDNPDHASFAELGVLADLTEQIESWGKGGEYFEGPWQSTVWKDKHYGVPDNSNCLTLWYNEQMLSSAGVQPPATWEELRAAAAKLTTDGCYGLAVSAIKDETATFQWLPFAWQAGVDVDNLDSPGGRAALQLWVDLINQGHMSEGVLQWDQAAIKDQFANGRAAMMSNGPWQIPVITEEAPDLAWNVVPLPEGKTSASILGGENRAIIAGSPNLEAAWDLVAWSQEPEELKRYLLDAGKLPSHSGLAEEPEWADDPVLSVFVEQLKVAKPRAYGPKYPEISTAIQDAIQAALSGESSVEQALARAQKTIDPLLASS